MCGKGQTELAYVGRYSVDILSFRIGDVFLRGFSIGGYPTGNPPKEVIPWSTVQIGQISRGFQGVPRAAMDGMGLQMARTFRAAKLSSGLLERAEQMDADVALTVAEIPTQRT